ncbi:MAG: toxin-antitoxin system Pin family toxin component [Bacteroidetes bacterium HLUCCA01]|nr:MAG: toxin-antitoxin system Pin family toxin component [Bacteroidetes bacterium HLUCCA01]
MADVAVLDANVLYPAPVRDLLLHLASEELYHPKWSDTIQQEWIRSLLAKRPDIKKSSLTNTREWMEMVYPKAQDRRYGLPKTPISLPDKDDIHVVETAISSGANYIITFNLKDYPTKELAKYGIQAIHPDDFICYLIDLVPDEVLNAFNAQVTSLRKPPKTADEVLSALKKCDLPKTVLELRRLSRSNYDVSY